VLRRNIFVALQHELVYNEVIKKRDGAIAAPQKGWKMPKTATQTAETIEFPTFDASKATDQMRAFAEKGVEQSKEVYGKMKTGAETAQKALETTFETAKSTGSDLSLKSIAAMRSNAEMGFAHLEALVGAKTLAEVIELQTAFFRKGAETAVAQAKDMQAAVTKAAEDVSKPMKTLFEKSVNEFKAV
jgi:phasin